MKKIGVVASNARSYEASLLVYKDTEHFVREEALVVVEDAKFKRKYLDVLRSFAKPDLLLTITQRSAIVKKPEIAREGIDIPYKTPSVRIIGERIELNQLQYYLHLDLS